MEFKRLLSALLCIALFASMVCIGTVSASATDTSYSRAAEKIDENYAYDGELGVHYEKDATTFNLWAPTAIDVKVNIYEKGSDDEVGTYKVGTYTLEKDLSGDKWNGVWTITLVGNWVELYYDYSVTLENGKTNLTCDPYAKAVGVNGDRAMIVDLDKTDPDGWENDKHIFVDKQSDAIVWELQIKDFSYNENSGVSAENRGKYLAFTENNTTVNGEGKSATGIEYLKSLGVNYVQLNPFYDFGSIDETGDDSQFNWGYDPKNYGVPEGSFSSNPYDGYVRINECKQMIKALHDAGIGVIMDVVFNHTYSTDSVFEKTVPNYYYRKTVSGGFSNGSGCGNDTASERAMFRKYMIDMCKYWVDEYHVDGYRFDLMGLHDVETMNLIRDELDKIDQRVIMYGEGWNMSTNYASITCTGEKTYMCTQANANKVNSRIAFFNDKIRDGIKGGVFDGLTAKGFIHGNTISSSSINYGIRANTLGNNGWKASQPSQCVTYASCHDNATLYDKIVAPLHGTDVDFRKRYEDCIQLNKLSAATVLTSQGISFFLAGEEMGRSKDGNENSYNSAATLNMLDWKNTVTNADLVSYYKGLIDIRKSFSPFTSADNSFQSSYTLNTSLAATSPYVAYTVKNNTQGEWANMAVILNGSTDEQSVTLKDKTCTEWVIIANGEQAGVKSLGEVSGSTFTVPASTAVIAVDKESFENVSTGVNKTNITIEHRLERDNKLLATQVISGNPSESYDTAASDDILFKYDVTRIEGDANGEFGDSDKTVTYYYDTFVCDSIKNGDLDGDGVVTILEATLIQKYLAKATELSDEQLAKADYNYDGQVDINDATFVQKYLAGMNIFFGSVTTKYVYIDESGKEVSIADDKYSEYRIGSPYTTDIADVKAYSVDEENLPENASGLVSGDIVVKYFYKFTGMDVTVHVKHNGSMNWTPYIWAWDARGDAFSEWPGDPLSDIEDGWFTIKFNVSGDSPYNIIISNNATNQTMDYEGFTASEVWAVIDDAKYSNFSADYLTFYYSKPE